MKWVSLVILIRHCTALAVQPSLGAQEPDISLRDGRPLHQVQDPLPASWALANCNGWSTCPSLQQYALLLDEAAAPLQAFPEQPKHKDLLPLSARDWISWLLAVFALFIAAGGGIGGGGILVPLYIIGFKFATEHAVALSNITIFGGAFANLICNIGRTHPTAARPLIDWDLILAMEPATIVGAVFGGFLNKLLPVWLTTVLLFVLLLVMSHKLWLRAKAAFDRETCQLSPSLSNTAAAAPTGSLEPLLVEDDSNDQLIERMLRASTTNPLEPAFRDATGILIAESRQVPVWKVVTLALLFVWLLVTDLWKNEVVCGGLWYWSLVLSIVPLVGAMMAVCRRHLVWKAGVKEQVGLMLEEGDIRWSPSTTLKYPAICSLAGLIAGLFGVGGGIVKGPLMLVLGVLPEVAAATSATMILFTAGSASIVYVSFGGIRWDYGAVLMVTGFCVTLAGQKFTYYIIEALGRRSVIIIAMALLLSLGCAVMAYESVAAFLQAIKHGFFEIASVCH